MASIRRSTRRATKMPPPMPRTTTQDRPLRRLRDDAEQPPPFLQISSDQEPEAAAQLVDAHQRAVVGVVLIVKPPVGGLGPAGGAHHAGRQRAHIAGNRLPIRRGQEI